MMGSEDESSFYCSGDKMETLILHDDPLSRPSSLPFAAAEHGSILEPPSYADAVFRSFDNSTNGHDLSSEPSGSTPDDYLEISVSDPQKECETSPNSLFPGSGTYYTYLITTRTNLTHFHGEAFGVRRRFKEFVTLADRLSESYRGFFIPIRPDKSVVEGQVMQKQEFVEQRRDALERYLRKLGTHPVIRRSEELRVFLEVEGRLPQTRKTDMASMVLDGAVRLPRQLMGEATAVSRDEVAVPSKVGRDLLRLFRELRQSVSNEWGGGKPAVVEEDKMFLERKERLGEFEVQLSNMSQQAESLVKAQQDIGETIGELGLTLVKLTKFETEEAMFNCQRVRAADMKNLATASVKASRLYRELNAQTVKHLAKLHEYLGVMLAVNNAFSDRTSALLTVQTLLSDLSSLHLRIEKLEAASSKIFGGDRSRIRKIEELKETARATEDAKDCAIREYEQIKENNKNELERLDKERRNDLLQMLKWFVVNQAGYAEKMANLWETVAEETEGYKKERTRV